MNKADLSETESYNCRGRCLLEMQKTLDAEVVAELLETVKDFYNDEKTSSKIKNTIIHETNEIVELIKKKASDLCCLIDEVFLHRRQRQSSFYKLCHTLARKAEGSDLPDESKCICFSVENLRMFSVDPATDSKMKLFFDLKVVQEAVEQIYGKLLCTKCEGSIGFGSAKYSMDPDCYCSVPTFSSQYKVHEAILDICMNKNPKLCCDSWYLTHLKRDADYYRQKASSISMSSEKSVDSFEIISYENIDMENNIGTELSNAAKEKFITGHQSAFEINPESELSDSLGSSTDSIISAYSLSDCKGYDELPECPTWLLKAMEENSFVKDVENKSMPSDIVKQCFSTYLNNNNDSKFISSCSFNNSTSRAEVSSVSTEASNNLKSHGIGLNKIYDLTQHRSDEASIDHPLKSYPSDALRNAFSSYFNKENIDKWLLK